MRGLKLAALALAGVVFAACGALAAGDPSWRLVSVPDDEHLAVIDANSIQRQGNIATATIAVLYSTPKTIDSATVAFMVFQDRYDCAAKTEQPISVAFYDESYTLVRKVDDLGMEAQRADGDDNRSKDREGACNPGGLPSELHTTSLTQLRAAWLKLLADQKQGK
jgi:hypothetical protein